MIPDPFGRTLEGGQMILTKPLWGTNDPKTFRGKNNPQTRWGAFEGVQMIPKNSGIDYPAPWLCYCAGAASTGFVIQLSSETEPVSLTGASLVSRHGVRQQGPLIKAAAIDQPRLGCLPSVGTAAY